MRISRPEPDEFDDFYAGYVGSVEGDDALRVLAAQATELPELLGALDDRGARYRYAEGKWSIKELLGHLIDTERIFVYRALSIARGERAPLPGMDQDDYVRQGRFDARPLAELLDEYGHVRRSTLALFAGLDEAAWERRGVANDVPVTVRALAFILAGHQAHHTKVLRDRYL